MCILLGAMFEMSFDPAMNSAKDILENNNATDTTHIRLAVHSSQIVGDAGYYFLEGYTAAELIQDLQLMKETCTWKSTNDDKCVDECSCIKLITKNANIGIEFLDIYGDKNLVQIHTKQYEEIIRELLREGNYTIMKSYLTPAELVWGDQYNQGMGWYRSEDRIHSINPNRGYLTNKKWAFIEDINIFILPLSRASKVKAFKVKAFFGIIFCLRGGSER